MVEIEFGVAKTVKDIQQIIAFQTQNLEQSIDKLGDSNL